MFNCDGLSAAVRCCGAQQRRPQEGFSIGLCHAAHRLARYLLHAADDGGGTLRQAGGSAEEIMGKFAA
ncbi:hypothetical protein [Massilia sp. PWRC2]|uniref:hypothetical protein n=1 Tax=Massilia sp. PWRC2 TaxID=2804626 RepID=UPI003CE79A73